jgi:hypothetical protein
MEAERAQLSSTATTLAEMSDRIEALSRRLHTEGDEALAADLFVVERGLRAASRRLEQVLTRLS